MASVAANRASTRFSTYSGAPSLHPSLAPTTGTSSASTHNLPSTHTPENKRASLAPPPTAQRVNSSKSANAVYANEKVTNQLTLDMGASFDECAADIKSWGASFDRMQDRRLEKQRYIMSNQKGDEFSATALGAKLERALGRRMVGQDASFTRRPKPAEKRSVDVKA